MQSIEPEGKTEARKTWQLPDRYMITGYFQEKTTLFRKVSAALDNDIRLIQFRAHWLAESEYLPLACELSDFVRSRDGRLMVKGDFTLLSQPWCHGLHLTSRQLALPVKPGKRHAGQWLAASCHDKQQIRAAEAMGMDFLTVSPVKPTPSHPGASPLGLAQAAMLTNAAAIPVFWLGGMSQWDLSIARRSGARGIAAIHEFWRS